MKGRTIGLLLAGALLGATLPAYVWWRFQSESPRPTAKTPAEARVLGVLDQMVTGGGTHLAIDTDDGRTLRLLAEATGAKNVVEVGTSTGYSALWICLALQSTGGTLKTLEIDPGRAAQARRNFALAGVDKLVEVVVGDAHQEAKQLEGPIDLVFLDADKQGYTDYLRTLLPLVRPGGLIAADNMQMAPEYLKAVAADPQLETVVFGRFAVTLKKR